VPGESIETSYRYIPVRGGVWIEELPENGRFQWLTRAGAAGI
jgi:hypothetical protein